SKPASGPNGSGACSPSVAAPNTSSSGTRNAANGSPPLLSVPAPLSESASQVSSQLSSGPGVGETGSLTVGSSTAVGGSSGRSATTSIANAGSSPRSATKPSLASASRTVKPSAANGSGTSGTAAGSAANAAVSNVAGSKVLGSNAVGSGATIGVSVDVAANGSYGGIIGSAGGASIP